MAETTTKLGMVRIWVVEAASAAALQTAVNLFLAGNGTPAIGEERLIEIRYQHPAAGLYSAAVIYIGG